MRAFNLEEEEKKCDFDVSLCDPLHVEIST